MEAEDLNGKFSQRREASDRVPWRSEMGSVLFNPFINDQAPGIRGTRCHFVVQDGKNLSII